MKTKPTTFSELEGQAEWLQLKFPFQRQMCPLREMGYSQLTSTLPQLLLQWSVAYCSGKPAETRSRSAYQHFSQHGTYRTVTLTSVIPTENNESKPKRMHIGGEDLCSTLGNRQHPNQQSVISQLRRNSNQRQQHPSGCKLGNKSCHLGS